MVTSTLICVAGHCVNRLLGLDFSERPIVLISLALGFMIHAAPAVSPPNVRGIAGLVMVMLASLGAVGAWGEHVPYYDWSRVGSIIGPTWESPFRFWSSECTWGVTVTLTAIGVSMSATRSIHFLNAVLLGALAFFCIQEGKIGIEDFTSLGKGHIEVVDWNYVQSWRWVAAA